MSIKANTYIFEELIRVSTRSQSAKTKSNIPNTDPGTMTTYFNAQQQQQYGYIKESTHRLIHLCYPTLTRSFKNETKLHSDNEEVTDPLKHHQ